MSNRRCPGRFFAEMEVALTVAVLLTCYDIHLMTSTQASNSNSIPDWQREIDESAPFVSGDPHGLLPLPETRRQVGIRWPQSPCEVHVAASVASLKCGFDLSAAPVVGSDC